MKTERHKIGPGCIGLVAGLLLGVLLPHRAFAQTGTISSQTSGSSTALQTFLQEQQALAQERQTLISQGATRQQLAAWRQQNASQFEALEQLAQQASLASELRPAQTMQQVNIPPNASSTLKDFLTTRAILENARAQIYNQLLQSLPAGASQAQVNDMMKQERQIFQQQNAGDLQLQAQRAQALGVQSAAPSPGISGTTAIPADATPQLEAFLAAKNALMGDRTQFRNQVLATNPADLQAAMQQWRQRNAARIEQLNELAQNLFDSTSNQESETQ